MHDNANFCSSSQFQIRINVTCKLYENNQKSIFNYASLEITTKVVDKRYSDVNVCMTLISESPRLLAHVYRYVRLNVTVSCS